MSRTERYQNMWKIKNKKMNKFEKNNVFFERIKKIITMIIKVKFALLILIDLKIEKIWLIN